MANQETAFGLRPVGLVGSATNSTGLTTYEISATNANAIFQYGLVTPTAGGVIDQAGATSGGTTAAVGVLMGVKYHDSTQKKPVFLNYWPGSGAVSVNTNFPVEAVVADNPNQLFAVAADATLTDRATALTGVFANASLGTSARTGVTGTGRSNSQLSVASIATTATLPLRIVGLVDDDANNDYASAGAHLLVRINAHYNAATRRFDSQTTADSTGT
jgi:hypothetical protein|tara:strand:+ start:2733 stop:3383 length:651 start_codon:yes stop_codon:yes gene_type:complete